MSEFDVRFAAYEKMMKANNNFGMTGEKLAKYYGDYSTRLQEALNVKADKALNKEYGKLRAKEIAQARAEQANIWQTSVPERTSVVPPTIRTYEPFNYSAFEEPELIIQPDETKPTKLSKAERLKQNPGLKARYDKFSNFKKMKGLKKAGKWGAIAALAVGAGALMFNKCSDNKKVVPPTQDKQVSQADINNSPVNGANPPAAEEQKPIEETKVPVSEETSEPVAEQPTYEPIVKLNDDGTYTTKRNDNFYKLAENLLKDYCAQNNIDKEITNKSPEVQVLAERIMRQNEYWYDPNCTVATKRYSAPMLYPNVTLNMVEFNDLVKKAEEVKKEEQEAA